MFSDVPTNIHDTNMLLSSAAIICGALTLLILGWFLLRRPQITGYVKILLLLGIGVLAPGAAMTTNLATLEHSTQRQFCASCHVMKPYTNDSSNPNSLSLPALHARNDAFGDTNCYACHQDYAMFGTILTKIGGMRHVWEYYTTYRTMPLNEALARIELYDPMFATAAGVTGRSRLPERSSRSA